ncbi:hypothetical protein [Paenibacillus sp. P46E]|uniref:hypothetical protein n=1 Tax=Paenibacillus sp. P46E TaxID=1349436 RepID=UPI0021170B7C|nr:hypothetical protein [Paenibacillus sp. P46E]
MGAGELKAVATAYKVEKTVEAATVATDVAKAGTTASKVADVVPEIVTSAPRPGRLKLDLQHFASDAGDTGKVQTFNPNEIRFSQNKVNDAAEIIESMKGNGWVGSPIEVVRMPDSKLTTIDNTRVLSAK